MQSFRDATQFAMVASALDRAIGVRHRENSRKAIESRLSGAARALLAVPFGTAFGRPDRGPAPPLTDMEMVAIGSLLVAMANGPCDLDEWLQMYPAAEPMQRANVLRITPPRGR